MDVDQAFGCALRHFRRKKKLSQERLALDADVNRNYISLIELGQNSPSVRMVFKLSSTLEVSPAELFSHAESLLSK